MTKWQLPIHPPEVAVCIHYGNSNNTANLQNSGRKKGPTGGFSDLLLLMLIVDPQKQQLQGCEGPVIIRASHMSLWAAMVDK